MMKPGGYRNYGWGKQITWAGKQALRSTYHSGHYATVASHTARWRRFCTWLKTESGIRDVSQITPAHVTNFASHLAQQTQEGMTVSYAKNQITSVNITLESLRGDRALWIKPGDYIDKRTSVRTDPPMGLNRDQLSRTTRHLIETGNEHVAAIALICRELGLRRKEAILLDLRLANHQAGTLGKVNITAGTKGGRGKTIDRWVPVSHEARAALRIALNVSGPETNLIPESTTLAQWMRHVSKAWSEAAESNNLGTLRDLRAAYACDRYQQITGHSAPAIMGERTCEKSADRQAREILAQELGHNRIDVLAAYIGSSR